MVNFGEKAKIKRQEIFNPGRSNVITTVFMKLLCCWGLPQMFTGIFLPSKALDFGPNLVFMKL